MDKSLIYPAKAVSFSSMKTGAKFPLAVVASYGPDYKTATKLVASIFTKTDQHEPFAMQKWSVQDGDVREDPAITVALDEFIDRHHATDSVVYNPIWGCPHEEGIDYPEGGACPQCPFWANIDRHTLEPKSLDLPLTPDQIIAGLSRTRDTQPLLSFEAVERHREEMIEPFLQVAESVLDNPEAASRDDNSLFSYATAFLVKWREPRVLPILIRWLSLPADGAFAVGGDTVTEWGSRMLASVGGGDLEPIKRLILNREANEFCRGQAIEALALLAAWNIRSQAEITDYFGWLAREGLERKPDHIWGCLASACADIEAIAVFEPLDQAGEAGFIDSSFIGPEELSEVEAAPRGEQIARFARQNRPFDDVANETGWWACFSAARKRRFQPGSALSAYDRSPKDTEREDSYVAPMPYIAPPKIGRNDRCPCGSGKKYKKCCGR